TREGIADYTGQLINRDGSIVYSTLSYAQKGLAVTLTGKRTENFVMRTSPNQSLLEGRLNWQPIVSQLRPQRHIAPYSPPSQELSELALSANVMLSPSEDYDFNLGYTHINTLENLKLYREAFAEANIRSLGNTLIDLGLHYMHYNQDYYQFKDGVPTVVALTPFAEVTYKVSPKKSFRVQAQYMDTRQDFGSWAFLSVEYAIAPEWSFAL